MSLLETPRRILSAIGLRSLGLGAGLVLALGLVALVAAVEVSSRPAFCGSCHIMAPYYYSWQQSSHHNVACVDCHIPPGVTAEIRKKYEALSMVARYFTGTYGTNPWTEVDDLACLRCHERRLLAGKELFGEVLFDHTAHLAEMRRGKTLRCTSCHSQIVQGSHMTVTPSTCVLCHFKDQKADTGTARCTLCHRVPDREIRVGNLRFRHAEVGRYGMSCTWCHARPEGSNGEVPRERCVTCHNEPSRLAEYGNAEHLHRTHVSRHKVDCQNCHLELQHVGQPRIEQAMSTCDTCHLKGHSPQLDLYTGIGGRGVDPEPAAMFLAGVRCEGCHIAVPGQEGVVRRAGEIACMSCHGPAYRAVYHAWKADLAERTGGVERALRQTEQQLDGRRAASPEIDDARHNLELVRAGGGVHNVSFAFRLLSRAHQDLNAARARAGLPALPLPWPEVPSSQSCRRCHKGVESHEGSFDGRPFRHAPHLGAARLECAACHLPHDQRTAAEVVRFDARGCNACHHGEGSKKDCLGCHGTIKTRKVKSPLGDFDHTLHLEDAGLACSQCHQAGHGMRLDPGACQECHE